MKVLMITPSYDPIVGGTETVVKKLATSLNIMGIKTDILTVNMDEKWKPRLKWEIEKDGLFKVYKIPAINIFNKLKLPNLLFLIIRMTIIPDPTFLKILKDYDIIHFHDEVDLTFPIFSLLIKKPKVFQMHTLTATYGAYNSHFLIRFLLRNSADLYLTASEVNKQLLRKLGINSVKILENGVDTTQFFYFNDINDENIILFIGRFEKRKGLHVLLNALKKLKTQYHLVIIGPNYNDDYYKSILSEIKLLNNKKHQITYLGTLGSDEIVKWLHKSSICVCPSLNEPFGMVVIEAMACGTPIIASSVGGIINIIDDFKDGILVKANDPDDLAEKIDLLIKNKDLKSKLSVNGRKKVEKYYSWETIAKKLTKYYKELVDHK